MANPNVLDEVFESFVNGVKLLKTERFLGTIIFQKNYPTEKNK